MSPEAVAVLSILRERAQRLLKLLSTTTGGDWHVDSIHSCIRLRTTVPVCGRGTRAGTITSVGMSPRVRGDGRERRIQAEADLIWCASAHRELPVLIESFLHLLDRIEADEIDQDLTRTLLGVTAREAAK